MKGLQILSKLKVGSSTSLTKLLPGVTDEELLMTVVEKTTTKVVAEVTFFGLLVETISCRITNGQVVRVIQNPVTILGG